MPRPPAAAAATTAPSLLEASISLPEAEVPASVVLAAKVPRISLFTPMAPTPAAAASP